MCVRKKWHGMTQPAICKEFVNILACQHLVGFSVVSAFFQEAVSYDLKPELRRNELMGLKDVLVSV